MEDGHQLRGGIDLGGTKIEAIVVTGAGGNFCSGGDVFEIIKPLTEMDTTGLLDFMRMTGELVKAFADKRKPVFEGN